MNLNLSNNIYHIIVNETIDTVIKKLIIFLEKFKLFILVT
jgi:hypothetical protein